MMTKDHIDKFKRFLDLKDVNYRPGKGSYQILQVQLNGNWEVIYFNKHGVLTIPSKLTELVSEFESFDEQITLHIVNYMGKLKNLRENKDD